MLHYQCSQKFLPPADLYWVELTREHGGNLLGRQPWFPALQGMAPTYGTATASTGCTDHKGWQFPQAKQDTGKGPLVGLFSFVSQHLNE